MKRKADRFIEWLSSVLNIKYRIGMRVIKTSIIIMICLVLSRVMKYDTNFMIISSTSALVTLQTSHRDTMRSGLLRTFGTMFGGVLGILCVLLGSFLPFYSEGLYIIVIPIMIIFNLYVCNLFKVQDASVISCMVLLIVASNIGKPFAEALDFAVNRLIDTLIGVTITTVFNNTFFPYRGEPE